MTSSASKGSWLSGTSCSLGSKTGSGRTHRSVQTGPAAAAAALTHLSDVIDPPAQPSSLLQGARNSRQRRIVINSIFIFYFLVCPVWVACVTNSTIIRLHNKLVSLTHNLHRVFVLRRRLSPVKLKSSSTSAPGVCLFVCFFIYSFIWILQKVRKRSQMRRKDSGEDRCCFIKLNCYFNEENIILKLKKNWIWCQ